jgi:F420-0:gamma-glutamyl ligase
VLANDIIVIAQKIVSKAEGRVVALAKIKPSMTWLPCSPTLCGVAVFFAPML